MFFSVYLYLKHFVSNLLDCTKMCQVGVRNLFCNSLLFIYSVLGLYGMFYQDEKYIQVKYFCVFYFYIFYLPHEWSAQETSTKTRYSYNNRLLKYLNEYYSNFAAKISCNLSIFCVKSNSFFNFGGNFFWEISFYKLIL